MERALTIFGKVVKEGVTKKLILSKALKAVAMLPSRERLSHGEGVEREEHAWGVGGTARRPVWLEWSKQQGEE